MNNVTAESSSSGSRMTTDTAISLGLGLTNECNLACSFCYRDPTRADRLSLDQVKAVMERLPVRSVNLGTGENGMQQRDMKTNLCQAHRDGSGTAPKIQSVQRPSGLREKVLQIGKGEIEAQPALGRIEVSGVLRCAGLEPFEVVIGGYFLHAHSGEIAPIESQVRIRAYIERIRNDKP